MGKYVHLYLVEITANNKVEAQYRFLNLNQAIAFCKRKKEQDDLIGLNGFYKYKIYA